MNDGGYGTKESRLLRAGIRNGTIRCPDHGMRCNPSRGLHASDCHWDRAVVAIYEIERAAESANEDKND